MKLEILWIDGCPSYESMLESLEQVMREEKIAAPIEMVQVRDDSDAVAKKFLGSPTLRIDGVDPFAEPHQTNFAMQCRLYQTSKGLRGVPTQEMLRSALRNALSF